MNRTSSLHIVRRFGPVGGMENYVWELTHALVRAGQRVGVVCEQCFAEADPAIEVIELGVIRPRPRWLAQLIFSRKVSRYVDSAELLDAIIHSHERSAVHQVTTFHGPPFLNRKNRALDFLSPRIHTWNYLEKREVCGRQVQAVLPNSILIGDQLKRFYPAVADRVLAPAYPGVTTSFSAIKSQSDGKIIGFMGREWKRKGLDLAVAIVARLRSQNPAIKLLVAGCDPAEIKQLFANWKDGYELLGWVKPEDFLAKIDLLLHPAHTEPFGMVIAEANAAGIPVIVSDQCGIAPLITDHQGEVIALEDHDRWLTACEKTLQEKRSVMPLSLSWDDLAKQHIGLYHSILDH